MPLSVPAEPLVKIDGGEITVAIGPRTYRVLGLEKNTSRGVMRVNVKVSGRNVRGEYSYHGDTLDMESFRQRATFTKQAAHELGAKEETIHAEVGKLWAVQGDLQREHIRKTLAQPVPRSRRRRWSCCAIRVCWSVSFPTSTNAAWWARRRTSALVIWRRCRACWKNRWPS